MMPSPSLPQAPHLHLPSPTTPPQADISQPPRDPRKLYPETLALGRPTPLHRRGTSSKYESLEELLVEHGYKDVRVVTPLSERDRQRLASGGKDGRKASLASLLVGSGAQRRGGGVVLDAHGSGQQTSAVDLLRQLVSGFPLPEPPSTGPMPTPRFAPPPSPITRPRSALAPLSPTPQRATKPLSFLTTDPYARPHTSTGHHTPNQKLHHVPSQPYIRRPLTPLTNRSGDSGHSSYSAYRPGTPTLSSAQPAGPVITPTRVQCRSHSQAKRRARTPTPAPPANPNSPSSPLLLSPSPPPSPTLSPRHTRRLKSPSTNGASAPARQRSIRALRAHLAAAAREQRERAERLRRAVVEGKRREGSESPEPDFSDPGMLREGSFVDPEEGDGDYGHGGGEGEGEDDGMDEVLWKGELRKGYAGEKRKRTGLPWGWR